MNWVNQPGERVTRINVRGAHNLRVRKNETWLSGAGKCVASGRRGPGPAPLNLLEAFVIAGPKRVVENARPFFDARRAVPKQFAHAT
ncbi:MAG TPA: hypothetical protein VFS52_14910 [Steroidobacteraceae bacterium]|nr:hypothetical protein [Steroidobacteraceae bacterium]